MKALFTLGLTLVTFIGFSQIKINEKNVDIDGNKNGFLIEIPYGDIKEVDKALKKELKSWKGNFKGGKTYFVDDVKNKKMGDNTFDVYATTEESGDVGGNVLVAIDLGGAFLSSNAHKDQYKLMQEILYDFAVAMAKDVIQEEINHENGVLKEQEKELKDMEKDVSDWEKEIEDMEKKIEENKAAIETSKKNQETKKEEIKQQQIKVQEVEKKKEAVK